MLSLRHFGLQIDWLDRLLADVADSCFSEFRIGPDAGPGDIGVDPGWRREDGGH